MKFSKETKERLKKNPNVKNVYPTFINYTEEFKQKAIYEYDMGKNPKDIFIDAGFVLSEISSNRDYPNKTINQWIYSKKTPTKTLKYDSKEHELLLAKIAYLEEENKMLKKLKGIEN